ncbi:MAG: 50S ribosomal protein L32 [Patescibacteria group bacterium]|nr:50S ribosomal protein L32 [Patescibacteria group bacterium]
MAAQPKQKISKVRSKTRRAHRAKKLPRLSACPQCKHFKPSHIACPECGYYGGKKILTTGTDKKIAKQLQTTKKKTTESKKKESTPEKKKAAETIKTSTKKTTKKSETKATKPKKK